MSVIATAHSRDAPAPTPRAKVAPMQMAGADPGARHPACPIMSGPEIRRFLPRGRHENASRLVNPDPTAASASFSSRLSPVLTEWEFSKCRAKASRRYGNSLVLPGGSFSTLVGSGAPNAAQVPEQCY